jgi:hypothetical protein
MFEQVKEETRKLTLDCPANELSRTHLKVKASVYLLYYSVYLLYYSVFFTTNTDT